MSNLLNVMTTDQAFAALQSRFALLIIGGQHRLIDQDEVEAILSGKRSEDLSMYKPTDGQMVLNRYLEGLPAAIKEPAKLVRAFWTHPSTRIYDAVQFSPLQYPNTTLNYWIGAKQVLEPTGDASVIKKFINEIICNKNNVVYEYVINYLAHMMQYPQEKPGIMIVLLGAQGVGKGTLFAILRKIWPNSTLQVADVEQVLGKFNSVLERSYVVCMDEALFSGDKRSIEKLKSYVTEPICHIEQKYQPSRTIHSYHRFFAASNHDHFGQIDKDDRRYLVLRVSSSRQGQHRYYQPIYRAIEDETVIDAFIEELKGIDLTGFNVRQRPKTEEHMNQKLQSLKGFERYWFEVLQTCNLAPGSFVLKSWNESEFISTRKLIEHVVEYDKNIQRFSAIQSNKISEELKRLCPSANSERRQIIGQQERGYLLPDIYTARREFERVLGGPIHWPDRESEAAPLCFTFDADILEAMYETYCLEDCMLP